jgi:cation diffusion facilitator family transporter
MLSDCMYLYPHFSPTMNARSEASSDETFAMNLSLATGVVMLVLKWSAFLLTDSSAAFSDALETVVHIAAVSFAAYSLRVVYRPPDGTHHFGHDKIAYFSSGTEGVLVIGAGLVIIYEAILKWMNGVQLHDLGTGIGFLASAAIVNAVLGTYLLRKGRASRSVILEANGKHVLSDVWTSVGAVGGMALAWVTGLRFFDPLVAILFALYIIREGFEIVRHAAQGLMDANNPVLEEAARTALEAFCANEGLTFHRLRLRESGTRVYTDFHLQFPNGMVIEEAHEIATRAERLVATALGESGRMADITSHLESVHTEEHDEAY